MKARDAALGAHIRWQKESKTLEGTVESWQMPNRAVVRVWDGRHTLVIAGDRDVEVIE